MPKISGMEIIAQNPSEWVLSEDSHIFELRAISGIQKNGLYQRDRAMGPETWALKGTYNAQKRNLRNSENIQSTETGRTILNCWGPRQFRSAESSSGHPF